MRNMQENTYSSPLQCRIRDTAANEQCLNAGSSDQYGRTGSAFGDRSGDRGRQLRKGSEGPDRRGATGAPGLSRRRDLRAGPTRLTFVREGGKVVALRADRVSIYSSAPASGPPLELSAGGV